MSLGAGTLTAGGAASTSYSGTMTGTGNFIKEGTGTLTFSGTKTYSGSTTINNGTLIVNGTDADSAVTVNAAGTLGGSGTVGAANVFGTIAPGNSIGTLTVNGSFTQSAGSTYVVEVAPGGGPGTSDLISVTGAPATATIQAGTTVSVVQRRRLHDRHPLHHPDRARRRDRHLHLAGRERRVSRLRTGL